MAPLVALTGFMGSGKSSVGMATARLLGWRFVDLDDEVAKAAQMTIPEIFAEGGEPGFRRREVEALKDVLTRLDDGEACVGSGSDGSDGSGDDRGLVLALGGGTLQTPEAAGLLAERGGVVFLDIEEPQAWERAQGGSRPLAQDRQTFAALLAARRSTYEHVADWILPVGDRGVEQLAKEVARVVRATAAEWPTSWGLQLVSTGRRSTVVGGEGTLASLAVFAGDAAACGARLFVITDDNVEKAWGKAIRGLLGQPSGDRMLVLLPGEQSKTTEGLRLSWDWLASRGARRDDVVVVLGGGVVGDLAGFAAATYQRGVGLWQVPTSLLAQVDSSVGGKTAVNLEAGKNLAGAFYQPGLVIIDPRVLSTLSEAEYINGLGEVVKYGLLAGEPLLGRLEEQRRELRERQPDLVSEVVKTCVRYKADVVDEDELDTGRRAVLNLGHTTAHALEVGFGYGRLRHGEAVALGLLVALAVSERLLGLDPEVRRRAKVLMADVGLPTAADLPPVDVLVAAAARDKKVAAGSVGFVGLRALGEPVWGLDLQEGLFEEVLEVIRA
jgi:shikimate kinase/3-dehydroquinate synthase